MITGKASQKTFSYVEVMDFTEICAEDIAWAFLCDPDNATDNFTKVVQRIPVRIEQLRTLTASGAD